MSNTTPLTSNTDPLDDPDTIAEIQQRLAEHVVLPDVELPSDVDLLSFEDSTDFDELWDANLIAWVDDSIVPVEPITA